MELWGYSDIKAIKQLAEHIINTKEMLSDIPLAPYYEKANLGNGLVASCFAGGDSVVVNKIAIQMDGIWSKKQFSQETR